MTRKTGSRGSPSGPLWTVQAQCRGVFAGAANGTVSYFGCGGELRRTFRDPARRHQVLCLRAVGRCLLTGGSDGVLRAYHVPSGRIVWRLRLMRQRDGIRRLTVHGGTVFALGKFGEMRCVRLDRHWDGPRPRQAAVGSSDAASGAWAGGAPGGPGSGETGWPSSWSGQVVMQGHGHGHGGLPLWLASPRVLAIREAGTQYAPASPSVELALEQGDEHE